MLFSAFTAILVSYLQHVFTSAVLRRIMRRFVALFVCFFFAFLQQIWWENCRGFVVSPQVPAYWCGPPAFEACEHLNYPPWLTLCYMTMKLHIYKYLHGCVFAYVFALLALLLLKLQCCLHSFIHRSNHSFIRSLPPFTRLFNYLAKKSYKTYTKLPTFLPIASLSLQCAFDLTTLK